MGNPSYTSVTRLLAHLRLPHRFDILAVPQGAVLSVCEALSTLMKEEWPLLASLLVHERV